MNSDALVTISPAQTQPNPAAHTASLVPACTVDQMCRDELLSLVIDVRQACLKAHAMAVVATLTGPSPRPVFLPAEPSSGPNYRGLLLLPTPSPKMAAKA